MAFWVIGDEKRRVTHPSTIYCVTEGNGTLCSVLAIAMEGHMAYAKLARGATANVVHLPNNVGRWIRNPALLMALIT